MAMAKVLDRNFLKHFYALKLSLLVLSADATPARRAKNSDACCSCNNSSVPFLNARFPFASPSRIAHRRLTFPCLKMATRYPHRCLPPEALCLLPSTCCPPLSLLPATSPLGSSLCQGFTAPCRLSTICLILTSLRDDGRLGSNNHGDTPQRVRSGNPVVSSATNPELPHSCLHCKAR